MNKVKMQIWGRDFEIPVIVKTFGDKEATNTQLDTLKLFEDKKEIVNESLEQLEKYVLENGLKENGVEKIDNIFKYVMPKTFYVPKNNKRVIALICNYKLDMEHGIAVVFENEQFKEIGTQDIIL